MTKPIIDENSDISNVDFNEIDFYTNNILTEFFYKKYEDKIDWYYFFKFQKLSEAFIIKMLDIDIFKVYEDGWVFISEYQTLSNKFIAKYKDKLRFHLLKQNENVDQEFIEKICLLK